jgi:hypothetical protein
VKRLLPIVGDEYTDEGVPVIYLEKEDSKKFSGNFFIFFRSHYFGRFRRKVEKT